MEPTPLQGKQSPNHRTARELPSSFTVSGLILKSLVHSELDFVCAVKTRVQVHLLHENIKFSQHHLPKRLLFHHGVFLVPLPKISWHLCEGLFLCPLFCSSNLCLFLYQHHTVWLPQLCNIILNQKCDAWKRIFFKITLVIWGLRRTRKRKIQMIKKIQILELFFLFMWKMPLEFLQGLHYICRCLCLRSLIFLVKFIPVLFFLTL